MRIALDAMGSDKRPEPDVAGAVLAAREFGDTILLVGNRPRIEQELQKHDTTNLKIDIVDAAQEIQMNEKPSDVMKQKPQSSMHLGMQLVRDGEADAFVTMGNTGAAHAIATLSTLRRIPGVKRPALTGIFRINGHNTIVLDVGANADCKPEWLEQFGIMGSIYASTALGLASPRVATLSNGSEEGKGNSLIQEAQARLQRSDINYVGNVEPIELLDAKADIIVCDGLLGNIFLKTFEGTLYYLTSVIREEANRNLLSKIGGLLMRNTFRRVRGRMDTREIGGAPLLGVNGVVIIGHGGADGVAICNAIRQARRAVSGNTVEAIRLGMNNQTEKADVPVT